MCIIIYLAWHGDGDVFTFCKKYILGGAENLLQNVIGLFSWESNRTYLRIHQIILQVFTIGVWMLKKLSKITEVDNNRQLVVMM